MQETQRPPKPQLTGSKDPTKDGDSKNHLLRYILTAHASTTENMTHSVEAAYGLGKTNPLNKAVRIPGKNQFNQAGEVAVIPIGLQSVNPLTPIIIITNSRYTIDGLTNHLQNWEDQGWIGVMNSELFKAMAYHLQKRAAMTAFHWIKGHSGIWGNEEADKLAGIGAQTSQHQHP